VSQTTDNCGCQALGCAHFHVDDPRRGVWTGQWPGEGDCERFDFFVNSNPDFPDLIGYSATVSGMLTRSGGSASSKPEMSFIAQLKRPHLVQVLSMQAICPAMLGRLKDAWLAIGLRRP
jgi:hypothetical protein